VAAKTGSIQKGICGSLESATAAQPGLGIAALPDDEDVDDCRGGYVHQPVQKSRGGLCC